MQAQGRDHERALNEGAPRAARREAETHAVALRVPQQDRAVALDADARERPRDGLLGRRDLLSVLVQVAERQDTALAVGARDIERIDVERLADLREHLAEDGHRIERHAHGVPDLDQ